MTEVKKEESKGADPAARFNFRDIPLPTLAHPVGVLVADQIIRSDPGSPEAQRLFQLLKDGDRHGAFDQMLRDDAAKK